MTTQIKTFGELDRRAYDQLVRCAQAGDAPYAVLCADHHVGYSQPIGGAIAYPHYISPSGVGYDIGCGNKAVLTNLQAAEINVPKVMDAIVAEISFGIGRVNNQPVDHPVLDQIAQADFAPQRALAKLAAEQLGTVGSGNHYVDLFADEQGRLWVGVHFGSRGFGHKTATGFLAMAKGLAFDARTQEGEMDAPPTLLDTRTELGQAYIAAMTLAGEYAYAGRDTVVDKVLQILGATSLHAVHNHHNFAWHEEHFGEKLWVVRKGCTPAFPGQAGFVGATMGDISVILQGVESEAAQNALYSTVHGAGRVMSRTQAAGKRRWAKNAKGQRIQVIQKPGVVDWEAVRRRMAAQRIELRGAGADEAPEVYKRLDDVLAYHAETIAIQHRLRPIGVAMAGAEVYDPYKD
jgi:tRNA-splicing ligase RtcB (3'-phosphate/5'-hydroxy nucleic acid ligase)